jgi:hypothetical protein
MRLVRVGLLAVAFGFLAATARADSLLAWEFTGPVTSASYLPVRAAAFPAGTPLSLQLAFDSARTRLIVTDDDPLTEMYSGVVWSQTLHLGDNPFQSTGRGGLVPVKCFTAPACDQPAAGEVEFRTTDWTEKRRP